MWCIIGRLRSRSWISSWANLGSTPLTPVAVRGSGGTASRTSTRGSHGTSLQGSQRLHPAQWLTHLPTMLAQQGTASNPSCTAARSNNKRPGVASWAWLHATCTRSHCVYWLLHLADKPTSTSSWSVLLETFARLSVHFISSKS